jgi:hypothetical protein
VQNRNCERKDTASKDNEEYPDLHHGLLNDRDEFANTLIYPQFDENVQKDHQDRETQYLGVAINILPVDHHQLLGAGGQGKRER